jgi:RNA polymerase sigma-70 factor (ECF subfamily)
MVTHPADLDLVQRCLAGERDARDQVGARLSCLPRIVAARNRRLTPPLDASRLQDVAGEVSLQVWNKLHEYNGLAALESWLYRFCEFTLLNAARRARKEQTDALDEAGTAARSADSDLDAERLHLLMARLPDDESAAVRGKHFDDLTFEQIAERLAIPLTTVKGRYYRGVERLRTWLGTGEFEVGR